VQDLYGGVTSDPHPGKATEPRGASVCHQRHAALPNTGRIGVENLPKFLANLRRYKSSTARPFAGLPSKKEIDDVIAYITAGH
jgi:hypothetical protein